MKLSERVAIISKENIDRLLRLYGKMNIDDLSRIVNNHMKVAINEIEEDFLRHGSCDNNMDSDLIKMESDIYLTDKEGNTIEVKSIRPEYISDIFS